MLDPGRCSELAFLVEIEAPLLRRHRIDRRTVDEDDLGLEIRIARGRPRELRRIVAVDEDEVLLYLDEIERIDAMTGTRNQITLLVPNVALDRDGRIIIPASRHARRSDPVDRLGPANSLFDPRSEERRVGKECVSTFRYRWTPDH